MEKPRVLIVDDDAAVREVLAALIVQAGYHTAQASSVETALSALSRQAIDLVLTDLRMPGADGFALLRQCQQLAPDVPVVMLTAHGTVPLAVQAMREGASDFLLKPFEREQVVATLARVIAAHARARSRPPRALEDAARLVGGSLGLAQLEERVARAAQSMATVLLRGESGTGKELVARLIHQRGARSQRPLIVADLGAIPDGLLESELFGHERGAFTGASERKPGRVELAEGGTLLLDEVGELTQNAQVKLLRLLQEHSYQPLGSTQLHRADVRFIAATHRNLEQLVAAGQFRADLYYRLNVVPIELPPLRARKDDLRLLIEHFCARFSASHQQPAPSFDDAAWQALLRHDWPGNVRELSNFIERLVVLRAGERLTASDVDTELTRARPLPSHSPAAPQPLALSERRREAERGALEAAIDKARGNRSLAARLLGVSRRTLYNKLAEHDIGARDDPHEVS